MKPQTRRKLICILNQLIFGLTMSMFGIHLDKHSWMAVPWAFVSALLMIPLVNENVYWDEQ